MGFEIHSVKFWPRKCTLAFISETILTFLHLHLGTTPLNAIKLLLVNLDRAQKFPSKNCTVLASVLHYSTAFPPVNVATSHHIIQ